MVYLYLKCLKLYASCYVYVIIVKENTAKAELATMILDKVVFKALQWVSLVLWSKSIFFRWHARPLKFCPLPTISSQCLTIVSALTILKYRIASNRPHCLLPLSLCACSSFCLESPFLTLHSSFGIKMETIPFWEPSLNPYPHPSLREVLFLNGTPSLSHCAMMGDFLACFLYYVVSSLKAGIPCPMF